jgi:hypothetical protein
VEEKGHKKDYRFSYSSTGIRNETRRGIRGICKTRNRRGEGRRAAREEAGIYKQQSNGMGR